MRVMKNKVIKEGDEILFAYHSNYWSRWGLGHAHAQATRATKEKGHTHTVLKSDRRLPLYRIYSYTQRYAATQVHTTQ